MRHIVLIGNSEFPRDNQNLPPLDCPKRDVEKMTALMADRNCGAFEDVVSVVNEDHTQIKMAIIRTLKAAKPNDMVMIYYSGHGVKDAEGNAYLCGRDTVKDEVEATGISERRIHESVESSSCNKIALIFDCCYSGKFGEGFGKVKGDSQLFTKQHIEHLDKNAKGIVFMSSCNSVQASHEDITAGHGVFTKYIIKGIENGDADIDGNGYITFDELFHYINTEMANDNVKQTPMLVRGSQQNLLHIAVNGRKIKDDETLAMDQQIQKAYKKDLISLEIRNECLKEIINFQKNDDWNENKINLLKLLTEKTIDIGSFVFEWRTQSESLTTQNLMDNPTEAPEAAALVSPPHLGGYRKFDVSEYEGEYLVVRPYYGERHRLRCYVIHVNWDDQIPGLGWREAEGKTDYINSGAIYMPKRASHLSFLAINSGSVRHILVEEWSIKRAMYGVISTLWNDQGAHLKPTSVPIMLLKRDTIDPSILGDLSTDNQHHGELIELFQTCNPSV